MFQLNYMQNFQNISFGPKYRFGSNSVKIGSAVLSGHTVIFLEIAILGFRGPQNGYNYYNKPMKTETLYFFSTPTVEDVRKYNIIEHAKHTVLLAWSPRL